jgi:hypothetical protein
MRRERAREDRDNGPESHRGPRGEVRPRYAMGSYREKEELTVANRAGNRTPLLDRELDRDRDVLGRLGNRLVRGDSNGRRDDDRGARDDDSHSVGGRDLAREMARDMPAPPRAALRLGSAGPPPSRRAAPPRDAFDEVEQISARAVSRNHHAHHQPPRAGVERAAWDDAGERNRERERNGYRDRDRNRDGDGDGDGGDWERRAGSRAQHAYAYGGNAYDDEPADILSARGGGPSRNRLRDEDRVAREVPGASRPQSQAHNPPAQGRKEEYWPFGKAPAVQPFGAGLKGINVDLDERDEKVTPGARQG